MRDEGRAVKPSLHPSSFRLHPFSRRAVFLAEDEADADAEVVRGLAGRAVRVVVELDGAEVNAVAELEVNAAADDAREAGLALVGRRKTADIRLGVRHARHDVGE